MSNDLKKWLEQQRQQDISDLELALVVEIKSEKPIGFGVCECGDSAKESGQKFQSIPGVTAQHQRGGRVLFSLNI